tara:strand:+ start:83 stop:511 length:429 start_codon:yes stop_codon:yes gene_type:complete
MIRRVGISDLDQILDIEKASFLSPWTEYSFICELDLDSSLNFVYEVDGTIIGYIFCWYISDEIHVNNLAVRKDSRRKGIARKMLGYIKNKYSDEVRMIHLEVKSSNYPAIEFYNSEEFYYTATRKRYYSDNTDALLLTYNMR